MNEYTFCILMYQFLVQPSSEKLSPAADGNKLDPQPDLMQRVRDHRTPMPKLHQTPPFRSQENPWRRKNEECKSQRGWRRPRKQGPLINRTSAHLTLETEAARTGPAQVYNLSLLHI